MSIDNNDYKEIQNEKAVLTNKADLTILDALLKFYDFSNNMSVKEVKEEIQEKLWIEDFEIRFRVFKVIYKDDVIGKVTVAVRNYDESSTIIECLDGTQDLIKHSYLKLAFAFCDVDRDDYNRKEGERYSLHRLLCDEPNIMTNTKYTKLDNEFVKNVQVSLPFQAYVDEVPEKEQELDLIKSAIIKAANSMQIIWMNGTRAEDIK